jgi:hypothetical protein
VINVFPKRLAKYLPAETQPDLMLIYNDISKQTSYPKGSPTRIAIEAAYGDAQMYMAIVATAVLVLALGAVLMWRGKPIIPSFKLSAQLLTPCRYQGQRVQASQGPRCVSGGCSRDGRACCTCLQQKC